MDKNLPISWELYRSFLEVIRAGSLSAAGRRLGLTQPTISRHIAELEAALGAGPLFTRSPQGLAPTEIARAIEEYAQTMESSASALIRTASGAAEGIAGAVRIAASEVIGSEVLPALLRDLRVKHPALIFEVVLSNQSADLIRREADIAIRMVRPKQAALTAKKIGDVMLGVFAHPDYLAAHGRPKSVDELKHHAIVGYDRDVGGAAVLGPMAKAFAPASFAYRTDNQVAQLTAIRAGFGIGVCQVALARREPRLTRLFTKEAAFPLETWITMHEDLRASRRMRVVFDHLCEALAGYVREGR
ncbi:MAG: LysR family transcriptional regulator [Alphaproteobacteria bacterium]|nr:LysR family transcriptional regulator [Alphaproteobacteria bacterium]